LSPALAPASITMTTTNHDNTLSLLSYQTRIKAPALNRLIGWEHLRFIHTPASLGTPVQLVTETIVRNVTESAPYEFFTKSVWKPMDCVLCEATKTLWQVLL
jgi:hypothetical protein